MRILLVEDSEHLLRSLRAGLGRMGHAVDGVSDGKKGLSYALLNPYDVIILDLMLPEMDGMDVLRRYRAEGRQTPILILSAKDEVDDRVQGLREGADDYLQKPFAFDELSARIDALSRRAAGRTRTRIEIDDLRIDTASRLVERGGAAIALRAREYALLLYLAERKGEVVSRIEIEDHLYGEENFPMSNAVPSTICSLRRKLSGGGEDLIETRRGLGYVLDARRTGDGG